MIIDDYRLKKPFTIREPRDHKIHRRGWTVGDTGKVLADVDDGKEYAISQSAFLDQLYPHSHQIYCFDYASSREKWTMVNNKLVFDGYADYHKSSLPMQWFLRRHKASIAFSADPKFFQEYNSARDHEMLTAVKAKWNTAGMTFKQHLIGKSLYGTGDAAVVEYVKNGKIESKVFSFENNESINYIDNPFTGEQIGVRIFYYESMRCVEIWDNEKCQIWAYDGDTNKGVNEKPLYQQLGLKKIGRRSEDDYVKIYEEYHGIGECPFTYFRAKGPIWLPAEPIINELEKLISDIIEAGELFFHPVLFLNGIVMNLPHLSEKHKTLASKTSDGGAEFLTPPQISSAFEFAYNERVKTIFDVTGTVLLHPEELKSGTDSMGYVEMLYNEEKQSAEDTYAEQHDSLNKMHRIHKKCVGLAEGKSMEYDSFDYTTEMNISIPENSYTRAQKVALEVQTKIKSRRTAGEEINNSPFEDSRLAQEREEDIKYEADLAAATKAASGAQTEEVVVGVANE